MGFNAVYIGYFPAYTGDFDKWQAGFAWAGANQRRNLLLDSSMPGGLRERKRMAVISGKNGVLTAGLHRKAAILVCILSVFLSSCTSGALSIDGNVRLQGGERWNARFEVIFAQAQYQFMGAELEQAMSQLKAQVQAQGVRVSMKKRTLGNGNVGYTINASGKGYQALNTAFFDGQPAFILDSTSDPPQVNFTYVPIGTFFGAALSRSFTLTGGKILSSNGYQESGSTVRWTNPMNVMQATLTTGLALDPTWLLGGLGVAVILGLIVLVARKAGKKRCPYCGARIPRQAEFCTSCGQGLSSDAWQSY